MLASALYRPQTGYYDSLPLEAAALLQSLTLNHPFGDGNKLVACALAAIFLRMNGQRLTVDVDEAERFVIEDVIGAHASIEAIATWLSTYLRAV